jgi:hypothetical protein
LKCTYNGVQTLVQPYGDLLLVRSESGNIDIAVKFKIKIANVDKYSIGIIKIDSTVNLVMSNYLLIDGQFLDDPILVARNSGFRNILLPPVKLVILYQKKIYIWNWSDNSMPHPEHIHDLSVRFPAVNNFDTIQGNDLVYTIMSPDKLQYFTPFNPSAKMLEITNIATSYSS